MATEPALAMLSLHGCLGECHPITETTLRAPSKRGGPRHSGMEEFTWDPPWCRHCFAQHQGEPSEFTARETSCRDDLGCPCCQECHSALLSILFLVPRIEPKTLHMLGRDLPETTFPDQPLGIPKRASSRTRPSGRAAPTLGPSMPSHIITPNSFLLGCRSQRALRNVLSSQTVCSDRKSL